MMGTGRGFRRIGALLAGAGVLTCILAVIIVVGDLREIRIIWDELRWQLLIWILPLAVLNHGLRYWRWEILLRHVTSIGFKRSTAVFLFSAGSLLIFTPARVGEIAKSVYARNLFGIPIATSLPVIVVERLADVVVMALLASLGLLLLGETTNLLLAGTILGVTLLVLVAGRPILQWGGRWKLVKRWADSRLGPMLSLASASQLSLLAPRPLGANMALGASAWMTEVLIFFLSLSAVGVPVDSHLLVLALAVFPLASLGGSISFLPGGLGATEGGLTALGVVLGGLSVETAVLAALLSRAAILGVVVSAGILSLLFLHRVPRPQQVSLQ